MPQKRDLPDKAISGLISFVAFGNMRKVQQINDANLQGKTMLDETVIIHSRSYIVL